MLEFQVPSRSQFSEKNQEIFDQLEQKIGFVPNLYAYYAKNETALSSDYLTQQNRTSSLKAKEREVINLVVSQYNECLYCQSAHTIFGKKNGFSEEQILELRLGEASFDSKLDALAQFTLATLDFKGDVPPEFLKAFFEAGYTEENLIHVIMVIGEKTISNYINNLAKFNIDFPLAAPLDRVQA